MAVLSALGQGAGPGRFLTIHCGQGYVTDLFSQYLSGADSCLCCRKPVQALVEERMGCGTGVCYGCAVFTRRGVALVCKDGPRFALLRVFPR